MARTKGIGLIELVKFLRKRREPARALLPRELHHYLDERILVGSWYPEKDVLAILRVFLQLVGFAGGYEQAGTLLARNNLATIYAHVLRRDASPRDVLSYISALWSNYHDSGREKATFTDQACRIEIVGFDLVSADYCRLIGAYNRELIEAAGGKVHAVQKITCTAKGDPTCVWEYEWSVKR